jgi:hypothetical protein
MIEKIGAWAIVAVLGFFRTTPNDLKPPYKLKWNKFLKNNLV